MAKRDNAPKKRKSNKQLRSNEQEWRYQLKLLYDRIRKFEHRYVLKVDIEAMLEDYGLTEYDEDLIGDIRDLRKEKYSRYAYDPNVPLDEEEYYGETSSDPVHISYVEIEAIYELLRSYEGNPMATRLIGYLNAQVNSDGFDEVARRISKRYEDCAEVVKTSMKYKPTSSRASYWLMQFKEIITGNGLSMDENAEASDYNFMSEGEEYLD